MPTVIPITDSGPLGSDDEEGMEVEDDSVVDLAQFGGVIVEDPYSTVPEVCTLL